jgi:hypothetical protein
MVANVVAYLIIIAAISRNVASDPDTLQDLCVAAPSSGIINAAFFTEERINFTINLFLRYNSI